MTPNLTLDILKKFSFGIFFTMVMLLIGNVTIAQNTVLRSAADDISYCPVTNMGVRLWHDNNGNEMIDGNYYIIIENTEGADAILN